MHPVKLIVLFASLALSMPGINLLERDSLVCILPTVSQNPTPRIEVFNVNSLYSWKAAVVVKVSIFLL